MTRRDEGPGRLADLAGPALLLGLAWAAVVAQLLYADWAATGRTLGDTDDAMRLVQVRAFLAGQGWFDLHEPRLSPPAGYDSHWSRLIDAGLAGLHLAFATVVSAPLAERLMRTVWPLLWLLPAIAAVAAMAWRIAGREAALAALVLVVAGLPLYSQFHLGRIDHHNVQIALSLAALAAAVWSDRSRAAAALAGGLIGLALAVGLESLPVLVVAAAVPIAGFLRDRDGAAALRCFALALAAATAAAFLTGVAPARWGVAVCDAIAINWAAPVVVAGLGLAVVAGWGAGGSSAGRRLAAVAAVAAVAAALFLGIEPRCLRGPFAMMDPALRPWMAQVAEMQPILSTLRTTPAVGATLIAFPLAAVLAIVPLAFDRTLRRDPGFVAVAVAAVAVTAIGMVAIKSLNYAYWLAIPLMATACAGLVTGLRLTSPAARVVPAVLLSPLALSALALVAVQVFGGAPPAEDRRLGRGCFDDASYARLAALPPGVVVTGIDQGAFVLALTPHAVLGAPYHRLADGILASHRAFALPPNAAREEILAHRGDYVVTCGPVRPWGIDGTALETSLAGRLAAGDVPAWLRPVAGSADEPLTIYAVDRTR